MKGTRGWLLVTAVLFVLPGCGGTLKFDESDAGGSDSPSDPPDDVALDNVEDPAPDPTPDAAADTTEDPAPDPTGPQCADGLDNDGDDLIDTEDWDCADGSTPVEGPPPGPTECSVDTHCEIGYWECDRSSGTCVEPEKGVLCDPCGWRGDCGGGIMDEDDPDADWCVYASSSGGNCSKDCMGDFDCPKGFVCMTDDSDTPPKCWPYVGSCRSLMDVVGEICGTDGDCDDLACLGGICTYACEAEHHCPLGMSCLDGHCFPD
jgi:hypothetical protein